MKLSASLTAIPCLLSVLSAAEPPRVEVSGEWTLHVTAGQVMLDGKPVDVRAADLQVTPAVMREVRDELHGNLPMYNPNVGGWAKGARLKGLECFECTARFLLVPESLRLKSAPGDGPVLQKGKDFDIDLEWGTFGRIEGSPLTGESKIYADYRHGLNRLDRVVVTADGAVHLKEGVPHNSTPAAPTLEAGELPLVNVWVPGRTPQLSVDNLLPILETAFPDPPGPQPSLAEQLLPKTVARLRSGEPLRIIAWGDSVTAGGFVADPDRWQSQFVTRLQERFPKAKIELIHFGWGGRNTSSFLAEPPGSAFNYQEKLLDRKPDLIVSEFVNDAWMNAQQTEERYSKLLADFQAIGAEWIVLTPHYVRPDWMGLKSERDCDDDPRPYVKALRAWGRAHQVPIADAAARWGRLWRQGIPYTTLLLNAINHPNPLSMKQFADALMGLFPDA
ncbi:MAG: hypothetical protein HYU66_07700 [Armatimonadetes bacterium]|nr:hypothetical protein [Armatimonadota bacterium]